MSRLEYYKTLSNPMRTVSKSQKKMIGSFVKDVERQRRSHENRLRILAKKRGIPYKSEFDDSITDDSSESDCQSIKDIDGHKEPEPNLDSFHIPEKPNTPFGSVSIHSVDDSVCSKTKSDHSFDKGLYKEELDARMTDLGLDTGTSNVDSSLRSQELRYWRKRVTLEEESAVKQAGMLLSLLSSFVESFTNAVGFKVIKTQGLSDAIQQALENGDFDLAIKSYCVSPQALNMLKNPMTSFMTSFGHVVLRTHIENVKRELREGIDRFNNKRRNTPTHNGNRSAFNPQLKDVESQSHTNHSVPWSVQPSESSRPEFTIDDPPPKPIISQTFKDQMKNIAPVIGTMKHIMSTNDTSEETIVDKHSPSDLVLS